MTVGRRSFGHAGNPQGLHRRAVLAGMSALLVVPPRTAQSAAGDTPPFAKEIAPGIYAHQGEVAVYGRGNDGDTSNSAFVVGRDAVAVIDAGGSAAIGARLRDAIRSVTQLPIRYVINTHMHFDHLFGNAAFEADRPDFVAHHKLARGLAARAERYQRNASELLSITAYAGTTVVTPTLPVEHTLDLDLGGRTLKLTAEPTAHTDNDLIVFDETTGTYFLGDILFAEHTPVIDGSIRGWIGLLDKLEKMPGQRVVAGHGPVPLPWPAALAAEKRYLETIARDVRAAIKAGQTLSEATRTAAAGERANWKLFDDFHARNVSAAFAELEWE